MQGWRALLVSALGMAIVAGATPASAGSDDGFSARFDLRRASTSQTVLILTGSSGANRLTVSGGPAGELILSSQAGVPSPGPPCVQNTPSEVTCPPGHASALRVIGLGGNDDVRLLPGAPLFLDFRGGSGNDIAVGAGLVDILSGGGGRDRLDGKGAGDELNGLGGNDTLLGGLGRDLLRGGAGHDRLIGGASGDGLNGGAGRPDVCSGGPGHDLFKRGTCEAGGQ
jgi:Ca2+-binding RTX toxin-like protein